MNRREFLARATIGGVTLPLLVRQVGCDGDGNGMGPGPGGTQTFTSISPDGTGHSHSITIADSELAAGSDRTYTTSAIDHTHTVSLTSADFTQLNRGCSVIKVSSQTQRHQHTWEIRYADKVQDITATSSATDHTHMVTVDADDINSAPASRTYTTTLAAGHTHDVTLDQSAFTTLQDCGVVQVTTSLADGHTHTFSITPA